QTLTNGKDQIGCAMSRPNAGSHWKWGVYRSGAGGPIGQSVHYLQHPMMGTTLEDVANDDGGGGPSDSDAGAGTAGTGEVDAALDDSEGTGGNAGSGGTGGAGTGGAGSGGQRGTDGTGGGRAPGGEGG